MEQVGELSDWIWLVVALIWVAVQILPRLFRSRESRGGATPSAPKGQEQATPSRSPSWPTATGPSAAGPSETEPSAAESPPEVLRDPAATPIEPR